MKGKYMKGFVTIIQAGQNREFVDFRPELVSSVEAIVEPAPRWPRDTRCLIHMSTGEDYATASTKLEITQLMERALSQA